MAIDGAGDGNTSDEREEASASDGAQEDALISGGAAGVGASPCAPGPGWFDEHPTCSVTPAVSADAITGSTKSATGVAVVGAIKGGESGGMGLASTVTEGGRRVCGTGRMGQVDAVIGGETVGATEGGSSGLCLDGPAQETFVVGEGAIWTRAPNKAGRRHSDSADLHGGRYLW